jgi:predicted Zn-dependent protease
MRIISRRDAILKLGAVSSVLVVSDCAINPATGERQLILVSREEEVALGRQSHPQILSVYGVYNDSELQNYVRNIGQQIVRESPGGYTFTFTLLDNPTVNAFAAPGGYVYFTRGIMGYFNDAAQFAGVMAHEVTHVVARHYAQQYSRAQVAQLGLGLGSIFIDELRQFGSLINLGAQLLFLRYSRDAETQADRYGVEYMTEAGYDGVRLSSFFNTLDRMQGSGGALPEWQSTHPDPGSRERNVRDLSARFQKENPRNSFLVNRNEYLQLVDGVVFGNDPRNGFVQNNTFYHPGLQVQFPVPSGWSVANQETEVRMTPQNQAALLIFQPIEGSDPRAVAEQFVSANKVQVQQSRAITVNGMNGFYVLGTVASDNSELAISSYFIRMGNTVFAFHGVAPPNQFGNYDSTFQRVVGGFNQITNRQYLTVSPRRIDVRAVGGATTLQQALGNFGVPSDQRQQHAILNGMNLNDRVAAGTRIKVVT